MTHASSLSADALRAELTKLNDERRDDERRTEICQELTLRLIAAELPADWSISELSAADVVAQGLPAESAGWLVTRDHGALVVGLGYTTLAQAFDVARRAVAS
jgi:hypothetical protein